MRWIYNMVLLLLLLLCHGHQRSSYSRGNWKFSNLEWWEIFQLFSLPCRSSQLQKAHNHRAQRSQYSRENWKLSNLEWWEIFLLFFLPCRASQLQNPHWHLARSWKLLKKGKWSCPTFCNVKYLYCFVILRWQNWRKRKNVTNREKTQDGEAGGGGGGGIKGTTTNSKLYTYTKRQRQNKLKNAYTDY